MVVAHDDSRQWSQKAVSDFCRVGSDAIANGIIALRSAFKPSPIKGALHVLQHNNVKRSLVSLLRFQSDIDNNAA